MQEQSFQATIDGTHSKAFIRIPFEPNEVWRAKEAHHIRGTLSGHSYRGAIEDGKIGLGAAFRRDTGLSVGDTVLVSIGPEGPLTDNVATDLAEALNSDEVVRNFFDSLPTFYRNNYVRAIESLKKPDSRARKIAETIELLRTGKREK